MLLQRGMSDWAQHGKQIQNCILNMMASDRMFPSQTFMFLFLAYVAYLKVKYVKFSLIKILVKIS